MNMRMTVLHTKAPHVRGVANAYGSRLLRPGDRRDRPSHRVGSLPPPANLAQQPFRMDQRVRVSRRKPDASFVQPVRCSAQLPEPRSSGASDILDIHPHDLTAAPEDRGRSFAGCIRRRIVNHYNPYLRSPQMWMASCSHESAERMFHPVSLLTSRHHHPDEFRDSAPGGFAVTLH
jgi:hypothetical protein